MMPKLLAYGAQFLLLTVSVALLLRHGKPRRRRDDRGALALAYTASTLMLLSSLTTALFDEYRGSLAYTFVMIFYVSLFAIFQHFRFELGHIWLSSKTLVWATGALVAVAFAQQFLGALLTLPGSDFYSVSSHLRPASLTGSYLHYPLAIAVLFFPLRESAAASGRPGRLAAWHVAALAVVLSLGRSGLLILLSGFALYLIMRRAWGVAAFTLAALGAFFVAPLPWAQNTYVARMVHAGSLSAAGNGGRVALWGQGLHMWLNTNLLIGQVTGTVTNAASNLGNASGTVVESGLLQQLLNFGVFGTMAFYLVLLFGLRIMQPSQRWLRSGMLAACLQSVVYQSIEVLPFMALLAVYPLLSDSFEEPRPPARGRSDPAPHSIPIPPSLERARPC